MQNNGSLHLRTVLSTQVRAWLSLAGMALMLVTMCALERLTIYRLAAWDPSPVALHVVHAHAAMRRTGNAGYLMGSSQMNQVQPRIVRDITGCMVPSVCVPGGDIVFIGAMARAVANRQKPPLILAEFSRYVASTVEEPVYRDTLRFVPAWQWMAGEASFALQREPFRAWYCDGILGSLLPFVRHSEGIKACLVGTVPRVAAWLVDPSARPTVIRKNFIADDGHVGPYPHRPPPYYPMPSLNVAQGIDPHKEKLWKNLLRLHKSGAIRLVMVLPPTHSTWSPYYEILFHATNSPAASLKATMAREGVQVIDSSTPAMPDAWCMDVHHFTWEGCREFSVKVAQGIAGDYGHAPNEPVCSLTGLSLADVIRHTTSRQERGR